MMMKRVKFILTNQNGNVLVMTALFMVFLLGMVGLAIDGGRLYAAKSSLQKALDASVLGGVQELVAKGEAEAISTAKSLGLKNNHSLEGSVFSTTSTSLKVSQNVTVPMTFARVLGFDEAVVSASAKAVAAPLKTGFRVIPIAVEKDSLPHNTELKCDNTGAQHGNCGYLAFNGRGAGNLAHNIMNGVEVTVGGLETVETEPGQKWGPVKGSFETLISQDAGKPHCQRAATADNRCSRVVNVVVIDTWDGANGRDTLQTVGLAAYWLEDIQEPKRVIGRFIRTIAQGEADESSPDYGLYGVQLVE